MIEPISVLTGYALGVSQNATWDALKYIAKQLIDRGGVNLEKLFLQAFYKAIDIHNKHYDETSRKALLKFKQHLQDEPIILFDVLKELNYRDFGHFMASIANEDFQRRLAQKLCESYHMPKGNPVIVQMLTDTLRYYRFAVLARVENDHAVLLMLDEVLRIRQDLTTANELLQRISETKLQSAGPGEIPLWMPRRNRNFINREDELEQLVNALRGRMLAGIFGMGGVGKTALANEVVHRLGEDFSRAGIIWVSGGRISWGSLLQMVIQTYEHIPVTLLNELDLEQKLIKAKEWLHRSEPLICLDDVHDSNLVKQVVEIAPACAILVTSRHHLDTVIPLLDEVIDLDKLKPSAAIKLLEARLAHPLVPKDYSASLEICKTLGFLPLAIEITSARMRIGNLSPEEMLYRLQEHRKRLDGLQIEDRSVRASFSESYEDLRTEEKQLFSALGFFTGMESLRKELVMNVLGFGASEVEMRLENLAVRSLLRLRNGRIDLHPLLQLFAQEKLATEWEDALSLSIAESLLTYVVSQQLSERENMMAEIKAGIEWCQHKGELDLQVQFVKSISDIWLRNVKAYWNELSTYIPNALTAAQIIGSRLDEAWLMDCMAKIYQASGEIDHALNWKKQALQLYQLIGQQQGAARALLSIGELYKEKSMLDLALSYHSQSLDLFQSLGDLGGVVEANASLSSIYAQLSDVQLAESSAQKALEILESPRYKIGWEDQLLAYDLMLPVIVEQGWYKEAFEHIERFKVYSFLDLLSSSALFVEPGTDVIAPISLSGVQQLALGDDKRRVVLAEYFMTKDATYLFVVRSDFDSPYVIEIKISREQVRSYVTMNFGLLEENIKTDSNRSIMSMDLYKWQELLAQFIQPIMPFADAGDIVWIVPHDVLHYLPFHAVSVEGSYLIERNPVFYTPNASIMKYCQAKRKGKRENILAFGDSDSERPLPNAREEAWEIANLFGTKPYLGRDARKSLLMDKLTAEREEIDILHFACHGYYNTFQPLKSGILLAPESDDQESNEFETTLHGLPISRFLTAEEIFGMELRADLVTLSSDESGVSEIRPGDELIGLMRAFIYAGTPSMVMSLWGVEDISTELFMVHFYERLKTGDTKVEALQMAQLYVKGLTAGEVITYYKNKLQKLDQNASEDRRKQTRINIQSIYQKLLATEEREGNPVGLDYPIFHHPFYWAPFILVGDWQ